MHAPREREMAGSGHASERTTVTAAATRDAQPDRRRQISTDA
jgi:hypothetical protein